MSWSRHFFRSPRLILSVATIGLAQVLAGLGLLLPGWFGVDLPPQSFPAPIDEHAVPIDGSTERDAVGQIARRLRGRL